MFAINFILATLRTLRAELTVSVKFRQLQIQVRTRQLEKSFGRGVFRNFENRFFSAKGPQTVPSIGQKWETFTLFMSFFTNFSPF